jgi:hypothetical protein
MTEPGETLRRIEASITDLTRTVTDTRERVIRIESTGLEAQVIRYAAKVDLLEVDVRRLQAAEERRVGARGLIEWIAKYGPAIATIAVAIGWLTLVAKGIAK